MERIYYLAYGSNLNIRQMQNRCPDATIVGTAVLNDYQLMFKGSKTGSYLTVEPSAGDSVPLGVWEVSKRDLARLDAYEGHPTFYYRKQVNIALTDKEGSKRRITAIIYIIHEERKLGIPTRYYLETCFEGYDDFGFNKDALIDAFNYSLEGMKNGK